MDWQLPERIIVLEFTGDFEGLEVTCTKNAQLQTYLTLETLFNTDKVDEMYQLFGDDILVRWNYHDANGKPIDPTGASVLAMPPDLSATITRNWLRAMVEVPVPLEQPSTNGVREPVETSPMDLGSMSTPN